MQNSRCGLALEPGWTVSAQARAVLAYLIRRAELARYAELARCPPRSGRRTRHWWTVYATMPIFGYGLRSRATWLSTT